MKAAVNAHIAQGKGGHGDAVGSEKLQIAATFTRDLMDQLKHQIFRKYRDRLMAHGCDVGGPGEFVFINEFYEKVQIDIKVSVDINFREMDRKLGARQK